MKNKETLEEAAKNNYPDGDVWTIEQAVIRRLAFMNGAKWQQEQNKNIYSEEDMREVILTSFLLGVDRGSYSEELEDKLIEQYKKK